MVNEFPFGMSQPENGTTYSEFLCAPGIFQWYEPKKRLPFTSQPEFPGICGKQPGILSKKIYDDFILIHPFCRFFREF